MAAGVGLEDGDVGIGSSCVGADLVAVDEDAKDGVLDGNVERLSLVASSDAQALAGHGDRAVGRHSSRGPVQGVPALARAQRRVAHHAEPPAEPMASPRAAS